MFTVERKVFFDAIRPKLYPHGMKQQAVDGFTRLLDAWEQRYQDDTPLTQFSDVLATVYHETATTMQPIHEFGDRAYFMKMYDKTGSRPNVARQLGNINEGDGARYPGRGYDQLTGRTNYHRATVELRKLGIINDKVDFEQDPDLVMQPTYAIPILFVGMEQGWFTGKTLDQFIDVSIDGDELDDFTKARAIINGKDRAALIAGYGMVFLNALRQAVQSDAPKPVRKPDVVVQAEPARKEPEPAPEPKPPAAPQPPVVVPTPENTAPEGWFAHLLNVLRSGRRTQA